MTGAITVRDLLQSIFSLKHGLFQIHDSNAQLRLVNYFFDLCFLNELSSLPRVRTAYLIDCSEHESFENNGPFSAYIKYTRSYETRVHGICSSLHEVRIKSDQILKSIIHAIEYTSVGQTIVVNF